MVVEISDSLILLIDEVKNQLSYQLCSYRSIVGVWNGHRCHGHETCMSRSRL